LRHVVWLARLSSTYFFMRISLAFVLLVRLCVALPAVHWFQPPTGITALAGDGRTASVTCARPNLTLSEFVNAVAQAYTTEYQQPILAALGQSRAYVIVRDAGAAGYVDPQRLGLSACWAQPLGGVQSVSAGVQTSGVDASLDRIDQRSRSLDSRFAYVGSGQGGARIFIIDTGIYTAHQEFGGRAVWLANYVDGIDTDCNGHGTHVASLAGGATYGTSKQVPLYALKVLDCSGGGTDVGVALAIQHVESLCVAALGTSARFVLSMSFQGGQSAVMDDAIASLYEACPTTTLAVAAAGNSGSSSCANSPGGTPDVLTVAASSAYDDTLTIWSNRGDCVEIAAPGYAVLGAAISSTTASVRLSGTSMSTPFVSGVCANTFEVLGSTNGTRQNVLNYLLTRATKRALSNSGLPLLYSKSDASWASRVIPSIGMMTTLVLTFGRVI
jgi:subtilisin family serine protease